MVGKVVDSLLNFPQRTLKSRDHPLSLDEQKYPIMLWEESCMCMYVYVYMCVCVYKSTCYIAKCIFLPIPIIGIRCSNFPLISCLIFSPLFSNLYCNFFTAFLQNKVSLDENNFSFSFYLSRMVSLGFIFPGPLVWCWWDGRGEAETEAGRGVAPEAPGGLYPHGDPTTKRSPALWAPRLLQNHDSQSPGQWKWPQLSGY